MAKAILINFHVKYPSTCAPDSEAAKPDDRDPIAAFGEALGLELQSRTSEEMQKKEDANRAAQNPEVKSRDKADSGTLVMDAEQQVKLEEFVRDLTASGYRLVDAYWQHKHEFIKGQATGKVNGRVYRLVFAMNQEQIMDERDALELSEDFLEACKTFTAPCLNVWDNATSQTVNIGKSFKRQGAPSRHHGDKSLRFRQGEYHYEPAYRRKPYVAPPRMG